jgi:hypothetical protein
VIFITFLITISTSIDFCQAPRQLLTIGPSQKIRNLIKTLQKIFENLKILDKSCNLGPSILWKIFQDIAVHDLTLAVTSSTLLGRVEALRTL